MHRSTPHFWITLVAAMPLLTACGSSSGPRASKPQQALPSLGTLEHQGRKHDLRDLMDPGYRETSDDPFARTFEPDTIYADVTPSAIGEPIGSERVADSVEVVH